VPLLCENWRSVLAVNPVSGIMRDVVPTDYSGQSWFTDPAWAPDHRRLAFSERPHGLFSWTKSVGIWMAQKDALRGLSLLTSGSDRCPSWSPDGAQVAFARQFPEIYRGEVPVTSNIWVADVTTHHTRALTAGDFHDQCPDWSPDGTLIAFESDRSGRLRIWLMDSDGHALRPLPNQGVGRSHYPRWNPRTGELLYVHEPDPGDTWAELVVCAPDGSRCRVLPTGPLPCERADWSPDGTRVAYLRASNARHLRFQVWVALADGSQAHQVYPRRPGAGSLEGHQLTWR